MSHPLDLPTQSGPLVVTLAYVAVYYASQLNILLTKRRLQAEYAARGEKFDRYFAQDRVMLAADRFQLNMLEHMPAFLVLLWAHAVFFSPLSATIAGAVYVLARIAYPFAMGAKVGRSPRTIIIAATGPGYVVLTWLSGGLIWALVAG